LVADSSQRAVDGRPLGMIVPVTQPGVGQQTRRIELGELSVGFEVGHSVHHNLSAGIAGLKPPFAALASVHLPKRSLADVVAPPAYELRRIGKRSKYPIRRRVDFDFPDNGILIGRDLR
jgi:hypothetical protein